MAGTVSLDDWSLVYEAEAAVEAAQGCVNLPTVWPTMTCPHTDQDGHKGLTTNDWSLLQSDHRRHMKPKERSERRRLYGKQPPTPPRKKVWAGLDWVRGSDAVMTGTVSSSRRVSSDPRRHQRSREPKWRRVETMKRKYVSFDFPTSGARSEKEICGPSSRAAPLGFRDE